MKGWRWLFIVEGLMTVAVGLLAAVVLPPSLDRAKFLTPEERILVVDRLQRDKPQGSADVDGFSWFQVRRAIFNIQVSGETRVARCVANVLTGWALPASFRPGFRPRRTFVC